jgi:hypothetical protein
MRSARRRPRERGAALAEFVVCFPVFLVLMLVAIDAGANVGAGQEAERAARDVAAQAVVGRVDGPRTCGLEPDGHLARRTVEVICATKAATGSADADVRVRLHVGRVSRGEAPTLVLCVMSRARSVSGLLGPVFSGRVHVARTEVGATAADVELPASGSEDPLAGRTWRFCDATGRST